MAMTEMLRTMITAELKDQAVAKAERLHVPLAQVIRALLREWLKETE